MHRSQKGPGLWLSPRQSIPDKDTKRADWADLAVVREDACEIRMCAEPCHVIERLVIKSQHVIACRNDDDPRLLGPHGRNRHFRLIQSGRPYFRSVSCRRFFYARGRGDEVFAAKRCGPFHLGGDHRWKDVAWRSDESENRSVRSGIAAEG